MKSIKAQWVRKNYFKVSFHIILNYILEVDAYWLEKSS